MLIQGMTPQEIRVLQEFRRLGVREMTSGAIRAIKHPAGGGEAPAWALVEKGLLAVDSSRENFSLTEAAGAFLAVDARPLYETEGGPDTGAAE